MSRFPRRLRFLEFGAPPASGEVLTWVDGQWKPVTLGPYAVETTITISDATPGLVHSVTVTGQTWVLETSKIICSVFSVAAGDTTPGDAQQSGLVVTAGNLVRGVGFDLFVFNPNGVVGTFTLHAIGV